MTETAGIPEKAPDVVVAHHGGDRFRASIRGHEVLVDQPVAAGGEDTAPTPTELFVRASQPVSASMPGAISRGTTSRPKACRSTRGSSWAGVPRR